MEPEAPGWRDMVQASPGYFAAEIMHIPGLDPIDVPRRLRLGAGGPIAGESSHYTAWRYLLQHTREPDIRLVHGRHDAGLGGARNDQAWVQLGDTVVFDGLTRRFYAADAFHAVTNAEAGHRYTPAEAARLMLKADHPGPWSDAERHSVGLT